MTRQAHRGPVALLEALSAGRSDGSSSLVGLEAILEACVTDLLQRSDVESLELAAHEAAEILAGPVGRQMERDAPESFDELTRQIDRLTAAADSAADSGIARLLDSFGGKPQDVLDYLAQLQPDESRSHVEVEQALSIETSYLSKVVRRLVQADLVSQWPEGRRRCIRATALGRRWVKATPVHRPFGPVELYSVELITTLHTQAGVRARILCGAGGRPARHWDHTVA